ncbi:MAG TPA: DUF1353 domain-containing protein [Longimicrobiales bacterium]|nr:DUF1353 domain-containing protein [Longimicrobiales bacterium]
MTGESAGADVPEPRCPGGESVISSPAMRLLAGNRCFRLTEDARYTWCHAADDHETLSLRVPEDFTHDFASVPRLLWWFVGPVDLGLASIFHDWLYRHAGRVETLGRRTDDGAWEMIDTPWSRRDADRLFARIMREQGVSKLRRRAAFVAVQWFGGGGWGR